MRSVKPVEPVQPIAKAPIAGPAAHAASIRPAPASAPKKKFETVGFSDAIDPKHLVPAAKLPLPPTATPATAPASGPVARPSHAPTPSSAPRGPLELELLLERQEEPNKENPLLYCERAYLLPINRSVPEAEAALRWVLADLQKKFNERPRGKLINLAVFDHRWAGAPERPPLVVLQWRDWRGDVSVDYPAALHPSMAPSIAPSPSVSPHDDRLADVFQGLEELAHLRTPVEGLDLAVRVLEQAIPSEATSACLYDINTDQLRFVSVLGADSASMQGQAVARGAGLFGQAVRAEHDASVFPDLMAEEAFEPGIDSRPGVDARNIMLRPMVHEHQLLGLLQLINRRNAAAFSAEDVHVMNYVAERLSDFLHGARAQSARPTS